MKKGAIRDTGYITWDWVTGEKGGEVSYPANTASQIIGHIGADYHAHFLLRDIIAAYGEPSHVAATGSYFGRVQYTFRLYFQQQGFSVAVGGSAQKPELNADLLVDGPDFFAPTDAKIIANKATRRWQGMQTFEFYCRDMQQDQDCRAYDTLNKLDGLVATAMAANNGPAPTTVPEDTTVDVRGFYWTGFEVIAFQACKTNQIWWVESSVEDLAAKYHALARYENQPVYMHVQGMKSAPGGYGHLGQYPHEFNMTEILEMRLPQAGDCE